VIKDLTHLGTNGQAHIVDVSGKPPTVREALATARVLLGAEAYSAVVDHQLAKGDVFAVARIAGIMAAKRTWEIIPLCHQLAISHVGVEFSAVAEDRAIDIVASCRVNDRTGAEMEAMVAVSVAALTLYDMCKSLDRGCRITEVRLLKKSGGKSGTWAAP
jgi:cyclic pyranopterin phosphate synthase